MKTDAELRGGCLFKVAIAFCVGGMILQGIALLGRTMKEERTKGASMIERMEKQAVVYGYGCYEPQDDGSMRFRWVEPE